MCVLDIQLLKFRLLFKIFWICLILYITQVPDPQNYYNSTVKRGLSRYLTDIRVLLSIVLRRKRIFIFSTKIFNTSFRFFEFMGFG